MSVTFASEDLSFDPEDYPCQIRSTSTFTPPTEAELKQKKKLIGELQAALDDWEERCENPDYEPITTVKKIAEIIEESMDEFLKRDPDPLDDRHPHRTHPQSAFGNLLKILFRNDDFMNKLVISYILGRDNVELSIQSCRLLLDCVPGLDSNVVFSEPDDFVPRLYAWAKSEENEMLQAYSMGLLAAALEINENASKYRLENAALVPVALAKLKLLKLKMEEERAQNSTNQHYPFTNFAHLIDESSNSNEAESTKSKEGEEETGPSEKQPITTQKTTAEEPPSNAEQSSTTDKNRKVKHRDDEDSNSSQPPKKRRKSKHHQNKENGVNIQSQSRIPSFSSLQNLDNSNSKWDILQPFLIGTHKIFPMSLQMYQRLILQYLAPTGEYQDLLSLAYEGNAMDLIMDYIDLEKSQDVRLTFDALKYLTSLLVHRKFALEFVGRGGVEALLKIPRSSLASVGVVTSLYYISYNSDVMETLCQLSESIVTEVVDYVLWCLEHSHESGMSSAAMFLAHAVYYKTILDRFDQKDGPRKLYNYIATLNIIQEVAAKDDFELTEEQVHTSTQSIRNAVSSFRSYVAAHLFVKLEAIRRSIGVKNFAGLPFPSTLLTDIPEYKSMKIHEEHCWDAQIVLSNIFRLSNSGWRPIEELRKLGLIKTMFAVHILSRDWNPPNNSRAEMSIHALEVISICACLPKVQLEILSVNNYIHTDVDGVSTLLRTALGDDGEEGEVRIASLHVLIICMYVCPEIYKRLDHPVLKSNDKKDGRKSVSKSVLFSPPKAHLERMWTAVRHCDGIMILLEIINSKVPLVDADNLRMNACRALTGLARCEQVRQLLSEMPLIANNGLQSLMREPVALDKRAEHNHFCREAKALLEIVTGKKVTEQSTTDLTQEKMHKQWIVENTKINYNGKELLQLIYDHLQRKGLTSTAAVLRNEADLKDLGSTKSSKPIEAGLESLDTTPVRKTTPTSIQSTSNDDGFVTPSISRVKIKCAGSAQLPASSPANGPKKFLISPMKPKQSILNDVESAPPKPYRALDDILTEYLRQQHAHCTNPVTTCPPFSLYYPHRCPEPRASASMLNNFAWRRLNYDVMTRSQRIVANWRDERFIFSRFRPSKLLLEHEETYTAASFSIDDEHLIVGLFSGELLWMNIETRNSESSTNCHNSAITNIEPSSDGTMLLTSSAFVRPLSALWKLGQTQEMLQVFKDDNWVKFSNLNLDRIIGTSGNQATLYDTETNHPLMHFKPEQFSEQRYVKNIASLSPCDQLVFSDGVLWDVRASQDSIHVFDKLNSSTINGVFHPHGNEIIINTEVFDVRNYRVLKHVPAIDQSRLIFNSTGNMMYSSIWTEAEQRYSDDESTSFRTLDTKDYSVITTLDIKKPLLGLCASHGDSMMAVIEKLRPTQNEFSYQSASQIRITEVGIQKDSEDDADEVEEDEENNHSDDGSTTDSEDTIGYDNESEDEAGVFAAIGRLNDMESDASLDNSIIDMRYSDSSTSESTSDSESDDGSSSSSWETASEEEWIAANNDDDDEADSSYEPDADQYNSQSTTALNPHLRRRNNSNA
ncbi:unnamed protein product [Caenorhabditis bovis]|uniref:LisH domain-containing protein n=1 Tax=Caenorhabditis bovis TaxID=2654633 RepID=A0A8S1EV81_9PELO|nr:unnamed protein product [Caenorhabditis bovis]